MKILFDLRISQLLLKRGIGRYVANLLDGILKNNNNKISVLISSKQEYPDFIDNHLDKINVYILEKFSEYTINDRFDFFFSDCFFVKEYLGEDNSNLLEIIFPTNIMKFCDQIVGILYDFIPLIYAGFYLQDYNSRVNYTIDFESIKFASHIFTISDYTKIQAVNFLKRNPDDITVIQTGIDKTKFISKNSNQPYDISKRKNYIVDISGDGPSKNYTNLCKAFAMAYESNKIPKDSKLYIICKYGDQFVQNIQKAILEYKKVKIGENIILTNYIPDSELVNILSEARAFIHSSYIEGSGLMALEAYATGTPSFMGSESCKEYVLPECSFDSNNNQEIADTIIKIYNNPDLCSKSLEFGRKLLSSMNPEKAAKKVIDKLKVLQKNYKKKDRIAVFIPGNGAIAEYTVRFHSTTPDDFDVFADISSLKDFDHLQSLISSNYSNIFPFLNYEDSKRYSNHIAKIFVLGNSPHHINSLNEAIKTKGENNRYLLLHEPVMLGTFWQPLGGPENIKKFIWEWYPELHKYKNDLETIDLYSFLRKYNIYLLKPLVELTGINNIIALNEKCEELIYKEFKNYQYKNKIKVDTIYLPYEKFENIDSFDYKDSNTEFIVGTFGCPSPSKQTCDIVNAINLLNTQGVKVKLLMAGPNITSYLKNFYDDFNNLIIIDNPPHKNWLKILNSVDLGIELRPNSHTNSSGCVSELVGLEKEVLLTENFVPSDLQKYFHFVSENVSVEELAKSIKNILYSKNKKMINTNYIFEKYSFKSLSEKIKNIIINNLGEKNE